MKKRLSRILAEEERGVLSIIRSLRGLLRKLRAGHGPAGYMRKLEIVHETLRRFHEEMVQHAGLEERVLFPFIEKHIPRLETVTGFLRDEHDSLRNQLRAIQSTMKKLRAAKTAAARAVAIKAMSEASGHLFYRLMHHARTENELIHRILDRELHPYEKKALRDKMRGG